MELSKRARACETLMRKGAYWRRALERSYHGGEQFKYRLTLAGRIVPSFGFKTWAELEDAGKLKHKDCLSSSTWPTEWALA